MKPTQNESTKCINLDGGEAKRTGTEVTRHRHHLRDLFPNQHGGTTMRNQNHFFDKALLYYGSYKGFGAIFDLFVLAFIILPIRLIKLLVRVIRR